MVDINAEQEMIKLLINRKDKIDEWMLELKQEYFTDQRRVVFNCINYLRKNGTDIDYVTIHNELKKHNLNLDWKFTDLPASTYKNAITILKENYKIRSLHHLTLNLRDGIDQHSKSEDMIKIIADEIFKLNESFQGQTWHSLSEITKSRAADLKDPKSLDKLIRTGHNKLDGMIVGLYPGDYVIIGARPSMGKSQFMLKTAGNIGLTKKVGIFSLEMQAFKLADRYISELTEIPLYNIKHRLLDKRQFDLIDKCASEIKDLQIMIDDSGCQTIDSLIAKMRILKSKNILDIAFIDHLGFVDAEGFNRNAELTGISRKIKSAAKELQIPIVVLSQLNRGVDDRENKRPIKSDLRDSGSLEQDADIIIMLYRHDYYYKDEPKDHTTEVIIEKNRDGECGMVPFISIFSIMKFEEMNIHGENIKHEESF
jgi:replicative DNA helicase